MKKSIGSYEQSLLEQEEAMIGRECRFVDSAIVADTLCVIVYDVKSGDGPGLHNTERRYRAEVMGSPSLPGQARGFSGIMGHRNEPW